MHKYKYYAYIIMWKLIRISKEVYDKIYYIKGMFESKEKREVTFSEVLDRVISKWIKNHKRKA